VQAQDFLCGDLMERNVALGRVHQDVLDLPNVVSVSVTVLGSFRETALIVEASLTGGYVPARV
jgi:hypothetical protein